jgi:ribonuclease BN (tRNA processing enzyme)
MSLSFRSLLSGSSGNAAMLWDEGARLLFDCGARAQYRCRAMFDEHASRPPRVAAVVVSHLHGDHINYPSLRVIEERRTPLYVHRDNADHLGPLHFQGRAFDALDVRVFGDEPFNVGGFQVRPIPVSHWGHATHGFVVTRSSGRRETHVGIVTDLCDGTDLAADLADVDFLFLEANHDPELLEENPNPNSVFHLENSCAGRLLCQVLARGTGRLRVVMLGHLSAERNTPPKALAAVRRELARAGFADLPVLVAPRHEPSEVVELV